MFKNNKKKTSKKPPVSDFLTLTLGSSQDSATSSPGAEAEAGSRKKKMANYSRRDMKTHGYYCRLVKPSSKQMRIHCSLCDGILRNACQTTCCGEGFCQECLEHLINSHAPCPACQAVGYHGYDDDTLQKEIKKMEVHCEHQDEGCQWVGTIKKLKSHLNPYNMDDSKTCGWIMVPCHLCSKEVARNVLQRHLSESCMQRRYQCQYCGDFKSTYEDVKNNHRPVCKFTPVACPNECGESVMQLDLQSHVTNDCPLKFISCEYKVFGCNMKIQRQSYPQHIQERVAAHMSMLARGIKEVAKETSKYQIELKAEVSKLKEENKQLRQFIQEHDSGKINRRVPIVLVNRDENDKALATHGSDIDLVTVADITMTGFSKLKRENDVWRSPPFYTKQRGHRMCLEVLANGTHEVRGQYLSVSMYFMRGEFDKEVQWPYRGELMIKLVCQSKGGTSASQTLNYTESTPKELADCVTGGDCAIRGKGIPKFIHLSELPSTFLRNDSLHFRILRCKLALHIAALEQGHVLQQSHAQH